MLNSKEKIRKMVKIISVYVAYNLNNMLIVNVQWQISHAYTEQETSFSNI
jgi:hypothetical protein